jgi:hypothetical protein
MAIARCDKHTPEGTKHVYKAFTLRVGYPETAAICGRVGCEAPARLWLTESERAEHEQGHRIFSIRTHSAKIRASNIIQKTAQFGGAVQQKAKRNNARGRSYVTKRAI